MAQAAAWLCLGALTVSQVGQAHAQASQPPVKVGLLTDMSGVFADADGPNGAVAVRMAIEDFGGLLLGQNIEFVAADHQNKADIGGARVREWFDRDGVDMVLVGPNSSVGLAASQVAKEKRRILMAIGSTTSRLSNEECSPFTIQYAYDTIALSKGTGTAVMAQGGRTWFFTTADFAFGESIEKDTREVVTRLGGTVVGSVRHPLATSDYSSYLLQAQSSRAQVLGLANAGTDTINSIKAVNEFGIASTMKVVAMNMYITDIHALGLDVAKGIYYTDGWYWDLNEASRSWARRFFARTGKMPTLVQAGNYSATTHFLRAVKDVGSKDSERVIARMRESPVNDFFATNGIIRPNGRMVHDMYLMQVKAPSETKYPWDYARLVQVIPGEQAAATKAESRCQLWN